MIVLVLILSTVSYSLFMLNESKQQVTQDITDFSRGSYDILIRPENARTDFEKKLGVLEENYLGAGKGGISVSQWQKIKNDPQVEIAAPVASVGLFTARERTFMLSREKDEGAYYQVEYSTEDGVRTYSNKASVYMYDFGEQPNGEMIRFPSSKEVNNEYFGMDLATFLLPKSYHQVAAVDPEEEGKLTSFDLTPLTKQVSDYEAYENGEYSIPIMSLKDVVLPISIKLTIDKLAAVTENDLSKWKKLFIDGQALLTLDENPSLYTKIMNEHISRKRENTELHYDFMPDKGLSPFQQSLVRIDENQKLEPIDNQFEGGGSFDYHSQRIGYLLDPVIYEVKENDQLFVKQTGTDKEYGAPVYRNIQEKEYYQLGEDFKPADDRDFIGFVENGTFSIRENTKGLASAPLGIYGAELPSLAADRSKKLHPTVMPGSFITTPAHGLISIEWAEKMKGKQPIDAIRVKAAGITAYDQKAAQMIKNLAAKWEKEGFTVDIVAGASLQNRTVEVEGFGDVIQSFTTLGAADTVLSSWNVLQIVVTILYGLIALTFLGFLFFNMLEDRRRDERLLVQIGWSDDLIRRIRRKEWTQFLWVPVLIVLAGFLAYGLMESEWLPMIFAAGAGIVSVLLYGLAAVMQTKQPKPKRRTDWPISLQNIWFYRFRLLAASIQMILMTALTCFLIQNVKTTAQTRLGAYVHGEIEGMFIIIITLLYVLSLTTLYQSVMRMWNRRKAELQLFTQIGWGSKAIQRYVLKETLIWAGVSILAGWSISMAAAAALIEFKAANLLASAIGGIGILLIIGSLSLYAYSKVNHKRGVKYGGSI